MIITMLDNNKIDKYQQVRDEKWTVKKIMLIN
jgi:hypothetical protein